jgi:hypothetical protein
MIVNLILNELPIMLKRWAKIGISRYNV